MFGGNKTRHLEAILILVQTESFLRTLSESMLASDDICTDSISSILRDQAKVIADWTNNN